MNASYVFTALGSPTMATLRAEADYYAAISSYAAHFARMEAAPLETAAFGDDRRELRLSRNRFAVVLDETIVRAVVAAETADAYLATLHAVARSVGHPDM